MYFDTAMSKLISMMLVFVLMCIENEISFFSVRSAKKSTKDER